MTTSRLGRPLLFPTTAGDIATKAAVVAGWQALAPPGHAALGGHSARRSGAKAYARRGVSLRCIMHLGRWSSACVLGYVEEALSETSFGEARPVCVAPPAEALDGVLRDFERRMKDVDEGLRTLQTRVDQLPCTTAGVVAAGSAPGHPMPPRRRWVVIEGGRCHECASTPLGMPSYLWRTVCGIRFASGGRSGFHLGR